VAIGTLCQAFRSTARRNNRLARGSTFLDKTGF
jgi:hypothetical protein